MRYHYILIFILCVLPFSVMAEPFFTNKTFFTKDKLDRIYFAVDGTFSQQLENDFQDLKAGELLIGKWGRKKDAENQSVCLIYTKPALDGFCFAVEKDDNNATIAKDDNDKHHFVWNHHRLGNWLLSEDGMQKLSGAYTNSSEGYMKEWDEEIANYFSKKILYGFDGKILSYSAPNGLGLNQFRGFGESQTLDVFAWRVENLRSLTVGVDPLTAEEIYEDNVITLGQEFLESKDKKAYFYTGKDHFYVQSEGMFDLEPIQTHPQKDIFLPFLDDNFNVKDTLDE